jgi:DivIVA domain-containing protein
MLTPHDIEQKQFTVHRLREGYAQKEVDDFLDEVVLSYREAMAELDGYRRADTAVLSPVLPEVPPEISQASMLLRVAEETARRIEDEAKSKATVVIAEAETTANKIINAANGEKHRVIGELEERKEKLSARLSEITSVHADVIKKLRGALNAAEGAAE